MPKKVIITGITGQDGSYMAEYCLEMSAEVYGVVRRTSQINDKNYRHIRDSRLNIVRADLLDGGSLDHLVQTIRPDYFINFAAQSFVGDSWKIPEETFMAGAVGVLKCLEAVRKYGPKCRFYNAGSSEQFGDVIFSPQNETHPFRPRSPYGAAKCAAHHLVKVYRESYNLYAVQGLLFNHESERRGEEFVTRKITKGFARITDCIHNNRPFESIKLGNIDAKRDWSHARDFVDAIWRMLNQDVYNTSLGNRISGEAFGKEFSEEEVYPFLVSQLKEYVVASGETHTVRDFINIVVDFLGYDCYWMGTGVNEKLVLRGSMNYLVEIDKEFYRPADVNSLLGDPSAIKKDLWWSPEISFDTLTKGMIASDLYESGISPARNRLFSPQVKKTQETPRPK